MSWVVAAGGWPEAAIAIAGTLLVGAVFVVAIWHGLATMRTRLSGSREAAQCELAEQAARAETAARLEQAQAELRELRERGGERR